MLMWLGRPLRRGRQLHPPGRALPTAGAARGETQRWPEERGVARASQRLGLFRSFHRDKEDIE